MNSQRVEHGIVLQGAVLREVQVVLRRGVRDLWRTDALPPSATITALLSAIEESIAAAGSPGARLVAPGTESLLTDRISTTEAARMLGLSERQVRNLGGRVGGQKLAGTWTFDRPAVLAEVDRREGIA